MTQAYYRKTPQQALEAQNASAEGLSAQEARRRAEQYGPNKLSEGKKKSTLQVFLEQFKDCLLYTSTPPPGSWSTCRPSRCTSPPMWSARRRWTRCV